MRSRIWSAALLTTCTLTAAAIAVSNGVSSAGAAAAPHRIQPGAAVTVAGVHCRAGLLLHDGKRVFVGVPASCTALPNDEGLHQDGCASATAPVGTPGAVQGARRRAVLVYDSFTRMEAMSDRNSHQCYYNDLALLRLRPADARAARGALPGMRSPKAISRGGPPSGSRLTSPSASATAGATTQGGWFYSLSQAPMFSTADIGMPFVQGGRLIGMLTQLQQGGLIKTSPGISNLHRALLIMRKEHKFRHVTLLQAGQRP